MKTKLTPKVVALVAAAVVGLVALGGWFGLLSPQRSKADSLEAQIADEQSKLNVAQLLTRSQKGGKGTTSGAELLSIAMPSTLQMPTILRQVQRLAKTSDVSLESFTPSGSAELSGYTAIPIDVTGRLFDVQTVGLSPGVGGAPELSASIRLAAFVYTGAQPPAQTPAATDSESDETADEGGTA
jgi:Tfp pilus assembly protein PilO